MSLTLVTFFKFFIILLFVFQRLFLNANKENLLSLHAGDTLADLCLSLPSIRRARLKVEEVLAGKPFSLPVSHADATAVRNRLVEDMNEI